MSQPREVINTQTGNPAYIFHIARREDEFQWETIVYLEQLGQYAVIALSNDDGSFTSKLTLKKETIVESRDNPCLDDALLSLEGLVDESIVSWYAPQTLGE